MKIINLFDNQNQRDQFISQVQAYINGTILEKLLEEIEEVLPEILLEEEDEFYDLFGDQKHVAGFVFMLSRQNDLQLNEREKFTASAISKHFNISHEEVENACVNIMDGLGISCFDEDLKIERHSNGLEFDEDNNNETIEFSFGSKISTKKRFEIEETIKSNLQSVNINIPEDDQLNISDLIFEEEEFIIFITGPSLQIDAFVDKIEAFNYKLEERFPLNSQPNLYIPDLHYIKSMSEYSKMDWERLQDLNSDEFPEFLDKEHKIDSASVEPTTFESTMSAFHLPRHVSLMLIQELLQENANNVEALICLAGWESAPERRIDMLEDAIEAGERELDIENMRADTPRWGCHETRPYMRALFIMGCELLHNGYKNEGIEIFYELLEMNPEDNQGVRIVLMESLLIRKKWFEASKLFVKYPNEFDLVFVYGKFFHSYYTLGRKSKTKKELIKAYERNYYPMHIIVGDIQEPLPSNVFKLGDINEASMVTAFLAIMMSRDEKLGRWMFDILMESGRWHHDIQDPSENYLPF